MKRILIFTFLFCWVTVLKAQYKTDTWFFGYLQPLNTDRDTVFSLKFQNDQKTITPSETKHSFESDFASISDSLGNLLLYTNGCMIADKTHQIISNGDGLNPGPMASELCGKYGYISDQGSVFIPVPGHTNDFWLIHMGIERDTLLKTKYGPLYATYIEGSSGTYKVTNKNQVLTEGNLERFAVVKHGDGKDWWIMVPNYNSNEYHCFLISANGIEERDVQHIGPIFDFKYCANGRGANAFSNLGKYYVRNNVSCGPVIFNFDRCKGLLEDPLYFVPTETQFGGGGVAFYPDDSKMYYCMQNQIRKIDFSDVPPKSVEIISYDSTYATTLGNMFMGPDSIIYINTQSSGLVIHQLIPKKNLVSLKDETFKPKSIKLPARNTRTIPMTINYSLGSKYSVPCDSFISSTYNIDNNEWLSIYPNPSQASIYIDLQKLDESKFPVKIQIANRSGQLLFEEELQHQMELYNLNISDWTAGLYVINVTNSKKLYTGKFIVSK